MSKYDVFISFKNTGSYGERTQDYYMAKDLYDALTKKGIQVFFRPESIMSTVYLAYDELRDKSVAVKVASNANIMSFDSIVQSLNAEVDILKRLVHPYLPRIYDVIEKSNMMVIIMDFIEGRPLQSIIN